MASITQGANVFPMKLCKWAVCVCCMCVCVRLRKEEQKQNGGVGVGRGPVCEKSSPVQMQILWRSHTLVSVTHHSSLSAGLPLIKWLRSGDNLIFLRGEDT